MTTESLSVTIEGELLTVEIGTVAAPAGGGGGSGDVVGPASATDDRIAAFDGVTGKLIKQGTVTATAVASHLGSTSNPHSVTAAQVGADPTGTAAAAVVAHAGAVDPHGDRAYADGLAGNYATAGHNHAGVYQPLATVLTNTTASFTSAQETKLAGIETAADVTDAGNVGAAIDGATAKTTPIDADTVALIDSAASNVLKKLSWANVKATAKAYFDTIYVTLGGALGTPTSGVLTNCTFPTLNQNTSGYAEALKSATTTVTVSAATAPSSGQVLTATSSTAATWQTPSGGSSNTKWVGAGELIPRVTSGAGIDGEELATNKINLDYLAFDSASAEYAQVSFAWPSGFTTFTAQFHWTAASGSGTVTWTAAARCYADDDALDQAQGTAQSVTDTLLAANDAHKSSATSAVTPGGTVASGNLCVAQFGRDIADTLAVDARLIGVLLSFA